jgi:hypothetical protein
VEDDYIAATARHHALAFVTGNDQDFRRPVLFKPFIAQRHNRRQPRAHI